MFKSVIVAAALAMLAPSIAFADSDGPDFPGLQIPQVSMGEGSSVVAMSHRSDSGYEPASGFSSPVTPDGVVTARNFHPQAPLTRSASAAAQQPHG